MAKIIDCIQGSDEWLQARAGKITASRIADVIAETKSGPAASRRTYQAELIVERMTGQPSQGGFVSAEMRWGIEQEPYARASYEISTGEPVTQVGFTIHDDYDWAGASPDGLVGDIGAVEIKCPNTANHLAMWEGDPIKARYFAQMQWTMFVNDLQWCDFVSYDPRVKVPSLQLFVRRVERDNEWIERTLRKVREFEMETRSRVYHLYEISGRQPA